MGPHPFVLNWTLEALPYLPSPLVTSGWPPLLSHLRTVAPSFTSHLKGVIRAYIAHMGFGSFPWPCPLKCLYISTDFRESQALFLFFLGALFPFLGHSTIAGEPFLWVLSGILIRGLCRSSALGLHPLAATALAFCGFIIAHFDLPVNTFFKKIKKIICIIIHFWEYLCMKM